jgi:hypothetical protein
MTDFELVTAADVQLMQGLAQRVTAIRPDLVSVGASYGELAGIWGQGHARPGRVGCGSPAGTWWRGAGPICRAGQG